MTGSAKLMTAGGGGVNITPASSVSSDVTLNIPSQNGSLVATDTNGNLGLGVTPSAWGASYKALQIGYNSSFYGHTSVGLTNMSSNVVAGTSTENYINSAPAGMYSIFQNTHRWFTAPSGTAGTAITFTQAMTLDSSGNLLVGTTDAQANFYVLKSANFPMQRLYNNAGTYSSELFQIITAQGSSSAFNFAAYYVSNATAYAAKIRGDGNIYNANNVYAAISDAKLKENVQEASPKLDGLLKVKVRSYNLIGDNQKQLGVIAQELEDVFPGLVEETADRDVDGVDLGTTTKSVKYSVFIPMLIKAVQEQQEQINELKAEIATLKGNA